MHQLALLAKMAVENYIKEEKIIEAPEDLPEEFSRSEIVELLKRRAGTFVTIERDGVLRGCIGTYLPTRTNVAEEIIRNAIAAANEDYRFGPIEVKELPHLSYTVYILSYPEMVEEFDPVKWASPKIRRILFNSVNPKKFGIIVKTGPFAYPNQEDVVFDGAVPYKTGLLLPDLEGINTAEQQFLIACQKAGINPAEEKIFIYRFTVEKYQ